MLQIIIFYHSQSPYNAFDGNPVFWTDPSGADVRLTGQAAQDWFGALKDEIASKPRKTDAELEYEMEDDIIFNSVNKNGKKTEVGRIVTDLFKEEINIDSDLIPIDLSNREPVKVNLSEELIALVNSTGIQAFLFDISGEAAYKLGVQLEVSLIGIVAGENKGDWGVTLQGNFLAGVEGSFTGSASAYWSLNGQDLSLGNLRGFEYGAQGSIYGVAGSYFKVLAQHHHFLL